MSLTLRSRAKTSGSGVRQMVKLSGGTKSFITKLKKFDATLKARLERATAQIGKKLKEATHQQIESGEGWAKNSPMYAAWKAAHGFDTRPMIRSHLLASSVVYERLSISSGWVGVSNGSYPSSLRRSYKTKARARKGSSSATVAQVVRWHEGSGGRYPSRPIFPYVARNNNAKNIVLIGYSMAFMGAVKTLGK